jgi:uncharacterized protein YbjQ (UPF0145 family)
MLVVTTWNAPGYEVREVKGEVFGVVVRSRSIVMNIGAMIRSLFGGEIKTYTTLLEQTRQQAIDRMIENASGRGANAILSMRFDASEIANTMSEIVAYGTAVVLDPAPGPTAPAMPPR